MPHLCEEELRTYNFEDFPLQRIYYDPKGDISKIIVGYHSHVQHLEDYWLNCEDEHVVRVRKYQRLSLKSARILMLHDIRDQLEEDDGKVLKKSYNEDRVYGEPIPDIDYEGEEMTSIDEFTRPVLLYTQHWINDFCKALRERGIESTFSEDKRIK